MSSVSYDLDTSGGLMPLIRALIKPPDEENVSGSGSGKGKKTQHPYYRRPGKGHNHDCCDACQEGGDLICCDRCPASFHLGCHDPPLEETDIPMGQWLCLECRSSGEKQRSTSPTTSHRSFEGDKKSRSLRINRSNSCVSSTSSSSRKNEREKERDQSEQQQLTAAVAALLPAEEVDLSPMGQLVRAAKIMNPTQFQLPREMQIYCPFPGTDVERNGKQMPHMKDSWGCVPLPARLCFHCRQSCRAAPLLQCDYCPLLYHQDCLDPPLTALPSGRWMCPNHVEQYIDWQLVNSISATERVALWERLSGPVDQHAIRIEFLRRGRAPGGGAFRTRVPSLRPGRARVPVPPMVKHHYANPPPLLPTRRETVRCRNVLKSNRNYDTSDEETEHEKKKTICMNLHCPKYLTKNSQCVHEADSEDSSADEREVYANQDLKEIMEDLSKMETESTKVTAKRKELSEDEPSGKRKKEVEEDNLLLEKPKEEIMESIVASPKKRKIEKEDKEEVKMKLHEKATEKDHNVVYGIVGDNTKDMKDTLNSVEEQLKKLDLRLVKLLAFQRLQQMVGGASMGGRSLTSSSAELDDAVAQMINRSIDKSSLTKYGFKHVPLPSELLSRADLERISQEVCGAVAPCGEIQRLRSQSLAMLPHRPSTPQPSTLPPSPSLSAMPLRATLSPVERPARNGLGDGLGRPVPMRLSRLSVGLGGGCDLQLNKYGTCSYLSERHALIFYDEVTRHFELINYSEFGSLVNGQLYSCDFTERGGVCAAGGGGGGEGGEERAAALRDIAAKRKGVVKTDKTNSMSGVNREVGLCQCGHDGNNSLVAGWEGGALLQHGALLQFGCLMFVFSIADFTCIQRDL